MWFFSSPPMIIFGEDALQGLRGIQGTKVLLVTDKVLMKLGIPQPVLDLLSEENIDSVIFDDVEPEPSMPTVNKGAEIASKEKVDLIIAVGGGSVIDVAKGIWILYENPTINIDEVFPEDPLTLREKARFVAIPTTSGTGSDGNWATVIRDPEINQKIAVAHRNLIPDVDILDPQFTVNLPAKLTASTAMDALAHAIEGYTVEWRNDFSNAFALQAVELIFTYLPLAFKDGKDLVAREKLHNASTMAGIAFGNSQIGGAHALAHSLGAQFSLPHSEIVALVLPHMMSYCSENEETAKLYAQLAYQARIAFTDNQDGAKKLIKKIEDYIKKFGMKSKISEFGITRKQFDSKLDTVVEFALNDTGSLVNPRELSGEAVRELLQKMF